MVMRACSSVPRRRAPSVYVMALLGGRVCERRKRVKGAYCQAKPQTVAISYLAGGFLFGLMMMTMMMMMVMAMVTVCYGG